MIKVEVDKEKVNAHFEHSSAEEAVIAIARLISIVHYNNPELSDKKLYGFIRQYTKRIEKIDKDHEKQEKKATRKERNRKQ